MATLDEISRAGLSPYPTSSGDQILAALSQVIAGGFSGYAQGRQERVKREQDMQSYYNTLRSNGYTAEEAKTKVNKTFEGMFTHPNFQQPTNDIFKTKETRDKAELAEIRSRTQANKALAGYRTAAATAKGTPKQPVVSTREMTPSEAMKIIDDPINYSPEEIDAAKKIIRGKLGVLDDNADQVQPDDTVLMTAPNGKPYNIPRKNMAKARARGFK